MKYLLRITVLILLSTCQVHAQTELWSLTKNGGPYGVGSIFKMGLGGSNYATQYGFVSEVAGRSPNMTAPYQASNGKLYGLTQLGGANGVGVIYNYDPVNNIYIKLFDFNGTNGSSPLGSLIQASNGKLYGMTNLGGTSSKGVIFSYDPVTSFYTVLHNFQLASGASPNGNLYQHSNGKLYGTTVYGGSGNVGVVFCYDPVLNTYSKLADFNSGLTGSNPTASLTLASNGLLYGMTSSGGNNNNAGVIFSFNITGNVLTKVFDFNSSVTGGSPRGKLLLANDGNMYGLATTGGSANNGTLFKFAASTNTFTKLYDFSTLDGRNPYGSLVQTSNGLLYGLTSAGGSQVMGVIFSYNYSTATYTKHYDFMGINGQNPYGSLMIANNGSLYGMTIYGGITFSGVLFKFDPALNAYTKLKDFHTSITGGEPRGNLVHATDGKLYGMTHIGGGNSLGALFSFNPVSNTYIKHIDFAGSSNGSKPTGGLTQASNGKLYGMTPEGGISFHGTIFSFDPITQSLVKIIDFNNTQNGRQPYGSLIQASNGKLYGMTNSGGNFLGGVIFSLAPSNNSFTKLYDFSQATGWHPTGSLMQASNGLLYGCTLDGGTNGDGVIFSLDLSTNTYSVLHNFNYATGAGITYGNLIQSTNGLLYGISYNGGTLNNGVIFSFNLTTNTYSTLVNLATASANPGKNSYGNLFLASDGKLYGMTSSGGTTGMGTIFSYDVASGTFSKLRDLANGDGQNPHYQSFIEINTAPSISTGTVASALCTSTNFNVPYTVTGTYQPGNIFTAQLSNSSGSFSSPLNIGTVSSTVSGNITASIPAGTIYGTGYRIRVISSNPGITGTNNGTNIIVNTSVPAKPSSVTTSGGAAAVCPGDVRTYSITPVTGVNVYTWTPPPGGNITNGQGTSSVTISYTSNFLLNDTLLVAASNGCGTSVQRILKINRNNPVKPGVITGQLAGLCNLSNVPYSVTNVSGVTYNWSFNTTGAIVTSGQGTNSVTVSFSPPFVTGAILVTANNACGTSNQRTLSVKTPPAQPGLITGPVSVCANQQGVPYSIAAVPFTNNYTWYGPSGSHINDGSVTSPGNSLVTTATTVSVNYSTFGGNIKVRANNSCGSGIYRTMSVAITCREGLFENSQNDISIYPNPVINNLHIYSDTEDELELIIYNILSEKIITENFYGSGELDLSGLSSGFYTYEIRNQAGMIKKGIFVKE